jgi:RHS repeat-associated protein
VVCYFHQDQLGSTRVLTDQAGTPVAAFTYDAYGRLTGSTGTATTPFLYAGQYRDAESSMYYLRARYYDPATAQFLSRDPLSSLTKAPYGYANDNPLNGTDPAGLLDLPFGLCLRNPFGGDNDNGGCQTALSTSQGEKYAGLALGAGAAITGVGAIADAGYFGLSSLSLSGLSFAGGAAAGGLDLPGCTSGDRVACAGMILGLSGAGAAAPELIGDLFFGVEEGTNAAAILKGLSALGLNLGFVGTGVDLLSLLSRGCAN